MRHGARNITLSTRGVCVCVCSAHNEQMHASYEGREHRYSQHLGMVKDWEMTQMT